jgi:hypothetical protein
MGAAAGNFAPGRQQPVRFVVPHHAATTDLSGVDNTFGSPGRQASTHFGVQGKTLHQYVGEGDTSYANADWYANSASITWEMVNAEGYYPWRIAEDTFDTSARLAADVLVRFGLGRATYPGTVRLHRDFLTTQCPGDWFVQNLSRYLELVNKYIEGEDMKNHVVQWDYHNGGNQLWRVEPTGEGLVYIVNKAQGTVLDVQGASKEPGAELLHWKRHGGPNQLWKIEKLSDSLATTSTIKASDTGLVVDDFGAGMQAGNKIIVWPSTGRLNQTWVFVPVGGGWYYIINAMSGKVLDAIQ